MDGSTTVEQLMCACDVEPDGWLHMSVYAGDTKDLEYYILCARDEKAVEVIASLTARDENRKTSEEVARLAARGLADPGSLTEAEIRAVCGSALGQVESEGGE